ncbi:TPA: fimbrial protein [Escherichia coli]|uniref:fimbrial protein n=1 Tax=Escherichia coli TaxID=562 RepID=UPI000E2A9FA9|nr:fimbrial protein [Escherichia coli]RDQ03963.1 Fimbrial adapter PapK precursor [Escherichia coli]RDQ65328.1 Fimbrial adapter PapK precursor [Escherichia coli]
MKGVISGAGIARLVGCMPLLLTLSVGAVDVTFDGELLNHPCRIDSGNLNQTVQFLERPVKDFQMSPGKGPAEKFSIRLVDCDTSSIWKTVKLKFSGNNEPEMKEKSDWFLHVSGVNSGKLAVGLLSKILTNQKRERVCLLY